MSPGTALARAFYPAERPLVQTQANLDADNPGEMTQKAQHSAANFSAANFRAANFRAANFRSQTQWSRLATTLMATASITAPNK